jgi:hypothetical protein
MHDSGTIMPDDPHSKIWRYEKFEHLENLLIDRILHFARADTVSDKTEGRLPESIKETLRALLPYVHRDRQQHSIEYLLKREEAGLEQFKLAVFLSCWHLDQDESMARWDEHSDRQVAIQSTYLKLRLAACEKGHERFTVSSVNYVDHENDFVSPRHFFTTYIHKDLQFKAERELRAISFNADPSVGLGNRVPIEIEQFL